jgi:sugar lactone lactonase YvrE
MRAVLLGMMLAASTAAWADEVPALLDQLTAALRSGDYAVAEADAGKLLALKPAYPSYEYKLALARAHLGKVDGSLAALDALADMGVLIDVDQEPAFALLKSAPGWPALDAKFSALKDTVGHATPALRLDEPDFIPEGIARDQQSGDFFVSSVHLRKIMRVHDGKASLFADRSSGLWSVLGIQVDTKTGSLWASTSALPQMEGFDKSLTNKTALARFDLKTGKLLANYVLAADGADHELNDVCVGPDGSVYAADGSGGVYVLSPGVNSLKLLTPPGALHSAQGMAVSPDGKRLYLSDYTGGLFAYDFKAGSFTRIGSATGIYTYYVDGLAFHGRDLVATQNGANPQRLVLFRLDDSGLKVWGAQVLSASDPQAPEPTLFTLVGDDVYLVADAQWSRFDDDGKLPPKDQLLKPLVLKVSVPK